MKKGRQDEYRSVTAQAGRVESSQFFNIPESFASERLNWHEAVSLRLGQKRTVTVVPPTGAMNEKRIDLPALIQKPSSWLLVMQDDFGDLNGTELEVVPASKKGTVGIRLLRSSGHVVAEGAGKLEGNNVVTFELKMRDKGIAKKSKTRPVFRGSLSADKQWRLETTL